MRSVITTLGLTSALLILILLLCSMQVAADTPKAVSVVGGEYFSAALYDNGSVWAWGDNSNGQLGDGTTIHSTTPVKVNITNVTAIAAGTWGQYTLALKNDGTVWMWGLNLGGNPGAKDESSILSPVQVNGLSHIVKIACGGGQNFALDDNGTLWAWGRNANGQLGVGKSSSSDHQYVSPTPVNISGVKEVACGTFFSVALKHDGTVWACGSGEYGTIGDGNYSTRDVFVQVPISDVKEIACGDNHALAVKEDGTVWAWGWNLYYPLGNYTDYSYQSLPVKVNELSGVVSVAGSGDCSFALKNDGTVWAWGFNQMGMLGQGYPSGVDAVYPLKVIGLGNVKSIAAGSMHAMALKNDGTIWAWGLDNNGEIGVEPIDPHECSYISEPVQVSIGQEAGKITVTAVPTAYPISVPPLASNDDATKKPSNYTVTEKWSITDNASLHTIITGSDGTLYAFDHNTIYCLDQNGKPKWNITVPAKWSVCTFNTKWYGYATPSPIYDTDGGFLYLYLTPSSPYPDPLNNYNNWENFNWDSLSWSVMAISPEGKIAWTLPLKTDNMALDDSTIKAIGGRVYVFHGYNETVIDRNGNVLFAIPDIAAPAAVDEKGYLYIAPAVSQYWEDHSYPAVGNHYMDYREPSNTIEAYASDGTLCWSKNVDERIERCDEIAVTQISKYYTLPLYQDGMLYVPFSQGIISLDTDGNIKWTKKYDQGYFSLFELMPMDSKDNLYLRYIPPVGDASHTQIYVIGRNGQDACPPRNYTMKYCGIFQTAASDGILYDMDYVGTVDEKPLGNESLSELPTVLITAYDIINDSVLWKYQVPIDTKYETVINGNNVKDILNCGYDITNFGSEVLAKNNEDIQHVFSRADTMVYPTKDIVYVDFRSFSLEAPIVYGESRCVYTSGLYALDNHGVPIYEKHADSPFMLMALNNSTIYYLTSGGNIGGITIGVASGIALIAAGVILFKFIGIGSVTRARSRLDKNKNRTALLQYVIENPGITMYDMSKALGMNLGTVRYHLLILELNHRIAIFKDDNKYIRYFPNSNRYSKEEQLIVSMIRRDTIKRVIQILFMKPGLTNAEISGVTGLVDSGVSRYLKELGDKGIVSKSETTPGRYAYSLTAEASKTVEKLYWVMNGESKTQIPGPGKAET